MPESWVWDQLRAMQRKPRMEAFVQSDRQERYEFVHVPKNAGTAVESAGNASGIYWGKLNPQLQGRTKMPDGNECSHWHVPGAQLPPPNPYVDAEAVFCVTRHPFNRFVSEYTWRLTMLMDIDTGGIKDRCSEEAMNYFLQSSIRNMSGGARWDNDCHFTPQSDFVWDYTTNKTWCTDVLRYDDLPSSFDALMRKWGLPVSLADATEENRSAKPCSNLDTSALTAETRNLIVETYTSDFERLGYDPDLIY